MCGVQGLCDGTMWVITEPSAPACNDDPLAGCDPTAPDPGTVCADTALDCWYAGGRHCWCSDCQGGSPYPICQTIDPPEWACSSPAAGCPEVVPQAGTSCSDEGLSCGPHCELQVLCEGGFWVWQVGNCPRCAAPDTPIATPRGDVPIAELRVGDLVYSVEEDGFVVVPIAQVGSTPVVEHRVMRVRLESGVVLEVSAAHPTADGRTFADLQVGGSLDGQRILESELVPYRHARTHDILPASKTGSYLAGGALIGSTLR